MQLFRRGEKIGLNGAFQLTTAGAAFPRFRYEACYHLCWALRETSKVMVLVMPFYPNYKNLR